MAACPLELRVIQDDEMTEIKNRYCVQLVRGIAMGGGMFAIFDGETGKRIREPTCWRDDADAMAARLNLKQEETNGACV